MELSPAKRPAPDSDDDAGSSKPAAKKSASETYQKVSRIFDGLADDIAVATGACTQTS